MRRSFGLACTVALAALSVAAAGQDNATTQDPLPRFRAGANLVRVDTYVTLADAPVKDLGIGDFEVLEDGIPQELESFELVQPRPSVGPGALHQPTTVAGPRDVGRDSDERLFVLFIDTWHVRPEGSQPAHVPLTRVLERAIGADDLVGVMHPQMAARNMTLGRRAATIGSILNEQWFGGGRTRVTADAREQQIEECYPDRDATAGIARQLVERRRETRTLRALEDLVAHLEQLRDGRKFVMVLSEGWLLQGTEPTLARVLANPERSACERERSMLAYTDHRAEFEQLVQRANRANVSFYPIDVRGVAAVRQPDGARPAVEPRRESDPFAAGDRLRTRHDSLRALAENTDGHAVVDSSGIETHLQRLLQDTGPHYLLGYYSTNTKLDGRFRRLTVRVTRPGVEVRARPGYLAPEEADLAAARVEALVNGAAPGHTTIPRSMARTFDGPGGARGSVLLRVETAATPSRIWVTGELDASLAKDEAWQHGARVRVYFEHDNGARPPMQSEVALAPGARTFVLNEPDGVDLAAGRYVVRVEVTPDGATIPFQTTTDAFVPEGEWLVSTGGLPARRGPYTGRDYVPTADARFRRTERIRLEIPRSAAAANPSARLLSRDGQPLDVPIALSERIEASSGQPLLVADLALAPLAQGEYALEITVASGDRKETTTYAFRLVP